MGKEGKGRERREGGTIERRLQGAGGGVMKGGV